jgi:hypothetical protein
VKDLERLNAPVELTAKVLSPGSQASHLLALPTVAVDMPAAQPRDLLYGTCTERPAHVQVPRQVKWFSNSLFCLFLWLCVSSNSRSESSFSLLVFSRSLCQKISLLSSELWHSIHTTSTILLRVRYRPFCVAVRVIVSYCLSGACVCADVPQASLLQQEHMIVLLQAILNLSVQLRILTSAKALNYPIGRIFFFCILCSIS